MDTYALTGEFWHNMLYGVLMGASVWGGVWCIRWVNGCSACSSGGFWTAMQWLAGIAFVFVFPCKLWNEVSYDKLREGKRGPVVVLRQKAPLIFNDFEELERMREREIAHRERLIAEKAAATSTSTQELYTQQIKEADERLTAIKTMWWRINNIATEMYFGAYLEKLEQHTTSAAFQADLQQIKRDCEELMRLHATPHE